MQTGCISRVLCRLVACSRHLSWPAVARWLKRPTLQVERAALLPVHAPASLVYLAFQPMRFTRATRHRATPGALTSRFHPYLQVAPQAVSFSVALSVGRFPHRLPVRKHGALRCPDFPTPLPESAGLAGLRHKGRRIAPPRAFGVGYFPIFGHENHPYERIGQQKQPRNCTRLHRKRRHFSCLPND